MEEGGRNRLGPNSWKNPVRKSGRAVAEGSVSIGSRVAAGGSVNLILTDSCTLAVNGGINVAKGNRFTIYGQSGGSGLYPDKEAGKK